MNKQEQTAVTGGSNACRVVTYKYNGHTIEFKPDASNTIASLYIDGKFEYDTLKSAFDAFAAARKLCDEVDALHNQAMA